MPAKFTAREVRLAQIVACFIPELGRFGYSDEERDVVREDVEQVLSSLADLLVAGADTFEEEDG